MSTFIAFEVHLEIIDSLGSLIPKEKLEVQRSRELIYFLIDWRWFEPHLYVIVLIENVFVFEKRSLHPADTLLFTDLLKLALKFHVLYNKLALVWLWSNGGIGRRREDALHEWFWEIWSSCELRFV